MRSYIITPVDFLEGRYWKTKTFKTREAMNNWIEKNKSKYQIEEVFINNKFGIEYRKLLKL